MNEQYKFPGDLEIETINKLGKKARLQFIIEPLSEIPAEFLDYFIDRIIDWKDGRAMLLVESLRRYKVVEATERGMKDNV